MQHMQQNDQKMLPKSTQRLPKPDTYGGKRKAQVNFVSLGFGESNRSGSKFMRVFGNRGSGITLDSFSFAG